MNEKTKLINLNERYRQPTLIDRNIELSIVFETLLRVEKRNVLLTGLPGVGKTALVEHIACLIADETVPELLKGHTVYQLYLNDLISGKGYRGVFEEKVKSLINTVLQKGKVILFVDEFHGLQNLGAMNDGKAIGLGDILKPYLTLENFIMIGATTNEELEIINDKALMRRFRIVDVREPSKEAIFKIIDYYIEKYNKERISVPENLSYMIYGISNRMEGIQPDKVINVVDLLFAKCRLTGTTSLDEKMTTIFLEQIQKNQFTMIKKEVFETKDLHI